MGLETALIVSAVASVAAGGAGMIANANANSAQSAALNDQAKADETALQLRQKQRAANLRKRIAAQRSAYGVSGIDNTVGTPVDVYAEEAGKDAEEAFIDEYDTGARTRSLRQSAANVRAQTVPQTIAGIANMGQGLVKSGIFN